MNCDAVTKQLSLLLYGELTFDEEEAVQQHLDSCAMCQRALESTTVLHRSIDTAELGPDPLLLETCRRNLQSASSMLQANNFAQRRFWDRFIPLQSAWGWIGNPVSAAALIAFGFFGARMIPSEEAARPIPSMSAVESGPVASRVRFVESGEQGRVQIVVEETRQRTLSGNMADDRIRNLLLRAARESSDPGVRVEMVGLLRAQSQSAEVRDALLHALRHDGNAGVRLKAIDALRPSADEPDTRRVLAEVLLNDSNPGVRTQAVDLLTQKHEPELVGILQESMTREDNNYVRMKCQRALNDMNASVGVF
jgi:HEAT repeats/Putative zinc-finger